MKVALVGNNDGPLILARSMREGGKLPVCIGLQKPVSRELEAEYSGFVGPQNYFSGFDESRLLEKLERFHFDILVNCFCNFKFTKILERYSVLNVHLAPLPKYRGRHPLHWALINGEKEFGLTVHKMDGDFDAGEIYWQQKVSVASGMSVEELRHALMKKLRAGFGDFLQAYENGTIRSWPNENSEATYAPKRNPEDSRLTEWHDRDTIYSKVMALRFGNHPAYLEVDGKKILVTRAERDDENRISGATGNGLKNPVDMKSAVIETFFEEGMCVRCKDGKYIRLYGFHPEKYHLTKNQELK